MNYFFKTAGLAFILVVTLPFFTCRSWAQDQDFEGPFSSVSYPNPFLPDWYANEFRSTSSRVFRHPTGGIDGSASLAIQPLSSFTGRVWVRLRPSEFQNPQVVFWAKTVKNGTGTRAAVVHASWSATLEGSYQDREVVGGTNRFPNQTTSYSKIVLEIPSQFVDLEEVVLKLEVGIGLGTGSAARWLLDNFRLEERFVDDVVPRVTFVKGFGPREVMVGFSESVDSVFSILPLAYALEGNLPLHVERLVDSVVVLKFENKLEEALAYHLSLQQVPDLYGNFLVDTLVQFTFSNPISFGFKSLVINEVMAAPRQDQDLPFVEYIELLNTTKKELRLDSLYFSSLSKKVLLPTFWIGPEEMILLSPRLDADLLEPFGRVLPLQEWPTLANAGTSLSLQTFGGRIIDQLTYRTASWGGSEFATGGYSLELPDPHYRCDGAILIAPSQDPRRGTPGRQNSIYTRIENLGPIQAEASWFSGPKKAIIQLNQAVISDFGVDAFMLSPKLSLDSTWVVDEERRIAFSFSNPVQTNLAYQVHGYGLNPCTGGGKGDIEATLIRGEIPAEGELILNELLADPSPGDPKFVEIYNTSDRYLALDGWGLATLDKQGAVDQFHLFGDVGQVLAPKGYLALSVDPDRLRIAFPQSELGNMKRVAGLPSLPSSQGTVILVRPTGEVEEVLNYDKGWHHPLLRLSKGVTLERISPYISQMDNKNWHSASSTTDYGTPGGKNSTWIEPGNEDNLLQVVPKVFDPSGSSGPNFTTIRYFLDQVGWVGSFIIYSDSGREVAVLGQQVLLGSSGIFSWSGTGEGGNRVPPGYYVLVVQLFDLNGKVRVYKKLIVVAASL